MPERSDKSRRNFCSRLSHDVPSHMKSLWMTRSSNDVILGLPQTSFPVQYWQVPVMDLETGSVPMQTLVHRVGEPEEICVSVALPHPGQQGPVHSPASGVAQLHPAQDLHWTNLPALPAPKLSDMRMQAAGGCITVISIIAVCISATHISAALGKMDLTLSYILFALIWAESALAFFCFLRLIYSDPGVIQRSEERCTPLPGGALREALLAGEPIPADVSNSEDPERGTFCARCLVWRRKEERAHHCSTCQRCVAHFDHHCGVFGRCIAGSGFGGNMGYFKTMIATGVLGVVTAVASVVTAFSVKFGWQHAGFWAAVIIGGYCGIVFLCGVLGVLLRVFLPRF